MIDLTSIIQDPEIRNGIPVIQGTRISVYEIVDTLLSDGLEAVLEDYPSLTQEDVDAAKLYVKMHPSKLK